MSCEKETAEALRLVGQKITPQRLLILSAVRHQAEHISATEIHEAVKNSYPFLDISTVYRTLSSARDLNLVTELNVSGSETQFEWTGRERHHHLICRVCGKASVLDSNYLEALATAIVENEGFRPALEHFAIVGTCHECWHKLQEAVI
jgi:Fe2+ or Zn2+ uptake regulation protein